MTNAVDDRWFCHTCPRVALAGESEDLIEKRKVDRLNALNLLDAALDTDQRRRDRQITSEIGKIMGQSIQTTGCPKCGGTMYKTVETDKNGNPIGAGPYVCNGCGHMM